MVASFKISIVFFSAAQEASTKQPITKPCEKNHSNVNPQEVLELKNVIKGYVEKNETLETVVKTLKMDKVKLLNRLQTADSQLTSLSNKITLSRSQPNLSSSTNLAPGSSASGGSATVNQTTNSRVVMDQSALINNSLDQILGILKKLPPPCQHSQVGLVIACGFSMDEIARKPGYVPLVTFDDLGFRPAKPHFEDKHYQYPEYFLSSFILTSIK